MRILWWLALTLALTGCTESAFDLGLTVAFPDRVAATDLVPVEAGVFRVQVSVCVEGLPSARATIVALRELGDGGPSERTLVLLAPRSGTTECPVGLLSGIASLPATGETSTLSVAVLGEEVSVEVALAPEGT